VLTYTINIICPIHAMKARAYRGSGGINPLILSLGTRRGGWTSPVPIEWEVGWVPGAGLTFGRTEIFLAFVVIGLGNVEIFVRQITLFVLGVWKCVIPVVCV